MKPIIASISAGLAGGLLSVAAAETATYDHRGFSEVNVSAGVSAEITIGDDYSVRAEGSDSDLEKLEIKVKGDTLQIGRRSSWRGFFKSDSAKVYVAMPSIAGVGASSGADATVRGVDAAEFSASASSGAELDVSGNCGALNASASSGAEIDADDLDCADVEASVSSGAEISVRASESISARASSGGEIDVSGDPAKRDVSKSSGGDVEF